jgi:hypothetical protein
MILLSFLTPAVASSQSRPQQWNFMLGAREANELSRIVNGVEENTRIADNVNSALSFFSNKPQSTLNLFGRLGVNLFREGDNRKRYTYGGGFGWTHAASERFQTQLSAAFSRGIRLETQSNLGILAPDIQSMSGNVQWKTSYQSGPRTTVSTSLGYIRTHVQNSQPIDGSEIVLDTQPFVDEFSRPLDSITSAARNTLADAETDVLNILATQGLLSKDTSTQYASLSANVTQQLSENSSIGFDLLGGYRQIDYQGTLGTRDGAQGAIRFQADRRVGTTNSLGTAYQFQRSLAIVPNTTVQTLVAGLTHTDQRRDLSFRLFGGASLYQTDVTQSRVSPVGEASFSAGLTRSMTIGAQYRRQYSLSTGFGRSLLIDYGNVTLTQNFGSKADVSLIAGVSRATNPADEGLSRDARRYGGSFTYHILEALRVGTTLFQAETKRSNLGTSQDTSRLLWTIFITFSSQFD